MGELATDSAIHGSGPGGMMSAETIADIAMRSGFDADPRDAIILENAADMRQRGARICSRACRSTLPCHGS